MNIVQILKDDYQHFPFEQTYDIYANDVYFKDPLNKFRGIKRYQKMLQFMSSWFQDVRMDLHEINQNENVIDTKWTLNWTTPLPWKPRIAIPGRSELTLNDARKIISHVDYWDCSRFDVVLQHLFPKH